MCCFPAFLALLRTNIFCRALYSPHRLSMDECMLHKFSEMMNDKQTPFGWFINACWMRFNYVCYLDEFDSIVVCALSLSLFRSATPALSACFVGVGVRVVDSAYAFNEYAAGCAWNVIVFSCIQTTDSITTHSSLFHNWCLARREGSPKYY